MDDFLQFSYLLSSSIVAPLAFVFATRVAYGATEIQPTLRHPCRALGIALQAMLILIHDGHEPVASENE
jgi:hypothetical protein